MGYALVGYVDRAAGRIELDPAVRVGTRLDGHGEAVLMHCTGYGHALETANVLARTLRRTGWSVEVKEFDELAPLREALSFGLDRDEVARLCEQIGPAEEDPQAGPLAGSAPPLPSFWGPSRSRMQCRVCLHLTVRGRGVRSHEQNVGHVGQWAAVTLHKDGTVTPREDEEGS